MLTVCYKNSAPSGLKVQLIQAIDVTSDWKLDYNLTCVITHIERASHKGPILENLKKAEWYLNRACLKAQDYQKKSCNSQSPNFEPIMHPPQEVCEDWKLTDLVASTLINLFFSRGHQSNLLKLKGLNAALECLREEIEYLKNKQNCKVSFTNLGSMKKALG
jgi:hypothetical protein